jgi:stringent starvation protein B
VFIMNLIDILPLGKISAQTLDGISQPTFGTLEITGGGGARASVLLKSDKTSVKEGETFKVRIEVKTGETAATINEYRLYVDFNPNRLTVIDQDSETEGTQISLLDTIFQVEDKETQNKVTQDGRITLIAKTASGNSFQVNREVAEIEFQARTTGTTTIKVVEGSSGTQLVRESGIGLAYTSNQITVELTSQSTQAGDDDDTTGDDDTDNTNTGDNTQTGTQIPDTAVTETLGITFATLGGILFIFLGLLLVINKETPKKKKL